MTALLPIHKILTLSVILLLFTSSAMSASNFPTWSTNSDIQTGTLTVAFNAKPNERLFESTYQKPFEFPPLVAVAIPNINILSDQNPILWKVDLPQPKNMTHIKARMSSFINTAIMSLKVSYFAVKENLNYLKIEYVEIPQAFIRPLFTGVGKRSAFNIKKLDVNVGQMNDISIVHYISGLQISSSNSQKGFSLKFNMKDQNSVVWNATCYGSTTVTQIASYIFLYDTTLGDSIQNIVMNHQTMTWKNNFMEQFYLPEFDGKTILVGVSSFHFTHGFSFNIESFEPSTFQLSIPTMRASFTSIQFSLFYIGTKKCSQSTPYLQKQSNLCYDLCPFGFLAKQEPTKLCLKCSLFIQNCASCLSKDLCQNCIFGYQLNTTLNECFKVQSKKNIRKLFTGCAAGLFLIGTQCVSTCPDGTYAVQSQRACMDVCPQNYFANQIDSTCVAQCPPGLFAELVTRKCVQECFSGYYADFSSQRCVITCPVGLYSDQTTRKCVTKCPSGYFAWDVMLMCVQTCPVPQFGSQVDKKCVNQCPTNYFANLETYLCVIKCPDNLYADVLTKQCVPRCSDGYFGDNITKSCVLNCPVESFADPTTAICVAQCLAGYYAQSISRSCVTVCPTKYFGDHTSWKCVTRCPAPFYGDQITKGCLDMCFDGRFGDSSTSQCVHTCPASTNTYGQNSTMTCVSQCPPNSFAQNSTRICVHSCWGGLIGYLVERKCISKCPTPYFADFQMENVCVLTCPMALMFYGQSINRTCVLKCPMALPYRQNSTMTCVEACEQHPTLVLFADNITQNCVARCFPGTWGDLTTKKCIETCPTGFFGNAQDSTCVQSCPISYFANPILSLCMTSCPELYLPNDSTRSCENTCPTGTFVEMASRSCVAECPSGLFGFMQAMACVNQCEAPYFGDLNTGKCVLVCKEGQYGSRQTRSCGHSVNCAPNFGVNQTRKCQISCPDGQWKNQSLFRCDACHDSCKKCVGPNYDNCTQCKVQATYLSTTNECLACSKPCSSCMTSTQCLSCIDGYYLIGTRSCLVCNGNCETCDGPSNCTSCASDRYLSSVNHSCICTTGEEDSLGNCVTLCKDQGCNACPNDKSVCSQCKTSFELNNGSCKCPNSTYLDSTSNTCSKCNSICASCSGPSQNQCTGCYFSQNRQIKTTTLQCDCKVSFYAPNNETVCIKEPMPECPPNFVRDSTGVFCTQICGDGKLYQFECDDGNLEEGDGCDSSCKIEANFSCFNNNTDQPTVCSYRGKIIFQLISALKDIYGNIIKLQYRIIPQLKFFQLFPDFTSKLRIAETTISTQNQRQTPKTSSQQSSSFSIMSALYASDSKTLKVDVAYHQTATGKTVRISYTPPDTPLSHAMEQSSSQWPVKVSNGLSLIYFPESTYNQAKTFDNIAMAIYIGSLCLFVLTLLFRKMIGIEIMILAQTQVLSLSILNELYPTLGVLTKEKFAFGYNKLSELMGMTNLDATEAVGLYKAINFSSVFSQNLNIMFFIICFIYLLAVIIRIVATRKQGEAAEKTKKISLMMARQIAFGFLLFSLINMVTSYVLEVYSGEIWNFSPQYNGAIKLASIITIVANFVIYGIYFKDAVDSYVYYRRNSKMAQIQPLFIATKAILIAVGIALYHSFGSTVFYALMAIQGTYVIFIIVLRPFKRRVDLVRSVIIQLSLLYILLSRFILANYVNLNQPGDWTNFLESGLPAEFAAIAVSLLLSLVSFIFHLFKVNAQVSPEGDSQFEADTKKIKNLDQSNIQIIEYFQDDVDDRKRSTNSKKFKVTKERTFKDSSTKLINLSEGQGFDSKRKLNGKTTMAESMEVIQMDE